MKIKISHDGFRELMSQGVLSQADERNFSTKDEWQKGVDQSDVLIQWDPNRDFAGKVLPEKTIQIGVRRGLLQKLNQNWILEIQDVTANARQVAQGIQSPGTVAFSPLLPLPIEKAYSLDASIGRRIGLN